MNDKSPPIRVARYPAACEAAVTTHLCLSLRTMSCLVQSGSIWLALLCWSVAILVDPSKALRRDFAEAAAVVSFGKVTHFQNLLLNLLSLHAAHVVIGTCWRCCMQSGMYC